jgi:hypothetical protein
VHHLDARVRHPRRPGTPRKTSVWAAPEFYRRNGWRAFGAVPAETGGISRIFLTKDFAVTR